MHSSHVASLLILTLGWLSTLAPSSAAAAEWPREGVALPALPPDEEIVVTCGPQAVGVLSDQGRNVRLVTTDALVTVPRDGQSYRAYNLCWLAQGHLLWPDDRGGVLLWNGSEARTVAAGVSFKDVERSPDGRSALIWPHFEPTATAAWLYDGVTVNRIPLPVEDGRGLAGMGWHEGAVRATLLKMNDGKIQAGARLHVLPERDFRVTTDGGRSWTTPAATPPAPQPLGRYRIFKPADALAWTTSEGQLLHLVPVAAPVAPDADAKPSSPFTDPPPQAALPIATLRLADGSATWPWDARAVDGRQPWPARLLAGRRLIVALYRQLDYHRGAPNSTWQPRIEGWALLDAGSGRMQAYDGPGWNSVTHLVAGTDGIAQVDPEAGTALTYRVGGPTRDLGQELALSADGWRAAWPRGDDWLSHERFALLARTATGENILLAWSGSAEPVIVHRSAPGADVRAFAWSDDGRRLAWIEHGRLFCWSPPAP